MEIEDHWEQHASELVELFKRAGFLSLARAVAAGKAKDYQIEAALRVVLLHRRIPYFPLSMSAQSDFERYMDSFGIDHQVALRRKEVAEFNAALPPDVMMFHVHADTAENDFGPGWVVVVQSEAFGFILEEFFTLTRAY